MAIPARVALALLLAAVPVAAQELSTHDAPPADAVQIATVAPAVITPSAPEPPKSEPAAAAIQPAKPDKPEPRGNFFTRPFYDKQIRVLAEANTAAAVMDDISSRLVISSGGYERNPLMRPFVHNSSTLAVESVGEVWLMAYLADRMKRSSHPLLRKTWWVPQVANITAKVTGGLYNSVLLAQ